ncbi:Ira1 kinase suppressor A [Hyphodiscus hymeniophilus]|uniref:Ira1 kinase suppressor A n=1 Tax=Hyphodiscus hymeniophilus TaxID=353542 RepID=A0A9P6VCE3_9HELO|nr:Ira1 kinase suppressor A [Hyphodiscus hymeniophilus]
MSLVPYSSREGKEIVLRHNDAIVLRDPSTQQLILRGAPSFTDCPTCHRPFRSSSPERNASPHRPSRATPFISPEYFRMLHEANAKRDEPPPSPIRRLVEPAFLTPRSDSSRASSVADAEFVASSPVPQKGHSIKKEAFSPNYFQRFFIEEKELGRGGKGVVLLGNSLAKECLWEMTMRVLIEVQLLQGLSHPNLVSYRHVWLEDVKLHRFGPSVPCAFILQQYCNSGDLLHYIVGSSPAPTTSNEQLKAQMRRRSKGQMERPDLRHTQRKLAFEEIYSFFKDIASGLAHLHGSNYIHRDLKPSNCLLHKDGNEFKCLISDFGEVQPENVVRKSTGSTGTISYCAPEVLKQDGLGHYGNFTTKSDIFSLGMILYFMCFGRLPYKSADSIQEEFEDMDLLRAEISTWSGFQDERKERPELPNQLYDFLKRLLAINPADRPSANDILHAIRTEKGLDDPLRTRNGSSSKGRIIQSIDSPMPGTPVNGTRRGESKRVKSAAYLEDASSSDSSPIPSPGAQLTLESQRSRSQNRTSGHTPTIKTPLLMPPPTTRMSTFQHRVTVFQHQVLSWAVLNRQALLVGTKLLIFLIKMISITRPCLPAATREVVEYPLFGIAALELALGTKSSWRFVSVFAAVHVLVLLWIMKWGGGLCVRRALHGEWEWE